MTAINDIVSFGITLSLVNNNNNNNNNNNKYRFCILLGMLAKHYCNISSEFDSSLQCKISYCTE
jgi:hypothetical protein